jgi:RND family efflux transporter MFP subunit
MMRKMLMLLCTLSLVMTVSACSRNGEAKGKGDALQKPPVAVETAVVAPGSLVEGIEVTGGLEPKFCADVKTQIPGLVKQVFVTEWVSVRKGQPLAKIDVAETEAMVKRAEAGVESAKAGLAQSQVGANRSNRELERILKLKESGLATQQSVDDARTEADAAKARVEASHAQLRASLEDVRQTRARLGKGLVVAPMDGVVALRDVNVGDLASDAAASKPIFRIVDNRLLNLTVTVPSADSARVKKGQPLEFSVDALPGKIFTGKVMFINPELSAADRSLKVIAEVRNNGELKGGFFAKGRIVTGSRTGVLQVPRNAMATFDVSTKKGSIFVVENGVARKRDIQTGAVSNDMLEVLGLKAGEEYVIRGGFNLRDGDRVSVAKAQNVADKGVAK